MCHLISVTLVSHVVAQKSSDVGNESNGPSLASEANLQTFMDTFVCQANQNGNGYFFFEVREWWHVGYWFITHGVPLSVVLRRALERCPIRWCRRLVGIVQLEVRLFLCLCDPQLIDTLFQQNSEEHWNPRLSHWLVLQLTDLDNAYSVPFQT